MPANDHHEWLEAYEKREETTMSLTITKPEGGSFELVPAGTHTAVCIKMIDFGPQVSEYNGERKEQPKVRLVWEVPAERVKWEKDGEEFEGPMTIGKTYTASMFEMASLRQHLESWRGKAFSKEEEMGFNLINVLGKPCTLGVQHDEYQGKPYAKITSVSPVMKGVEVKAENDLFQFDFDAHTEAELDALPDWMKDKVMDGKALLAEQKARVSGEKPAGGFRQTENPEPAYEDGGDEIPF